MITRSARRLASAMAVAASLAAGLAPAPTQAQAYPNKAIHFINFLAAGGASDVYYRILCEGMAQALGQPIVTENRPGAAGYIALNAIAMAAPDGYTIGAGAAAPLSVGPLLRPAPYDPVKSFTHMGLVYELPLVLAVSTASKIASVPQLLAYARANPGKLNFGSNGTGSTTHLGLEWLKIKENVNIVHIPFKDDVGVTQGFKTNEIQLSMYAHGALLPLVKEGTVKELAVLAAKRDPDIPDIPSSAEAGLQADFFVGSWASLVGPAGVPRDIVLRLNRAMFDTLAKPDLAKRAQATQMKPRLSTPEEAVTLLTTQIARWKDVMEKGKIKVEQ